MSFFLHRHHLIVTCDEEKATTLPSTIDIHVLFLPHQPRFGTPKHGIWNCPAVQGALFLCHPQPSQVVWLITNHGYGCHFIVVHSKIQNTFVNKASDCTANFREKRVAFAVQSRPYRPICKYEWFPVLVFSGHYFLPINQIVVTRPAQRYGCQQAVTVFALLESIQRELFLF